MDGYDNCGYFTLKRHRGNIERERERTTNVVANLNEAMGDGGEFK